MSIRRTDEDVFDLNVDNAFEGLEVSEEISDDAVNLKDAPVFQDMKIRESAEEYVTRVRAKISGILAISLWSSIVGVIIWNLIMISLIAESTLKKGEVDQSNIQDASSQRLDFSAQDKASAFVGDTAKGLYAVITPLATSVTGFYFVFKKDESESDDIDDD